MKLIVITRPEYFVVEHLLIHELFNEGLDILHLRKPSGNLSLCERLLSMLTENERGKIVIHDNYELKGKYGLYGIHLNSRNPESPKGYKGNVSCLCRSLEKARECKRKMKHVMLGPVFDGGQAYAGEPQQTLGKRQLGVAADEGIIDGNVYAYGGVSTDNIGELRNYGFGGAVVYGSLAKRFNPVSSDDFKEFIRYFRLLRRATE